MALMLRRDAGPDEDAALDELRLAVAVGAPLPPVTGLPERCARAVTLAQDIGAPLIATVDAALAARDDLHRGERAVTVASAQTRTVAVGLLLAPVLLVPGLARIVGADLVGFYRSGIGLLVLAVGILLLALGAAIVVVLVRRVGRTRQASSRHDPAGLVAGVVAAYVLYRLVGPALALPAGLAAEHLVSSRRPAPDATLGVDEAADLVATALTAGVSGAEALRLTADTLPEHAARLRRLAFGLELGMGPGDLVGPGGDGAARQGRSAAGRRGGRDPFHRLAGLLAAADRTGAPVADSVRHLARELRADDLAQVLAAAERLPAQLTFPTALCLLPATVLLIGAPIVHAGLSAAGY